MKLALTLTALVSAVSAANEFRAMAYNPKQLKTGDCPTVDSVSGDLEVLSKYTNEVRIYSVQDCNQGEPVLRAMENTDWKVQLGLWINKDDSVYEADKKELLRLAGVFDFKKHVTSVIVGNEAIYREEQTSAQVAAKVRDVKQALTKLGLSIPVTTSETWPSYDKQLIDAVDYVNMHAFPFWEGIHIDDAQSKAFEHIYDLQKLAGSKKVVVGETGWPDSGANYDAAEPSLKNEQRYLQEFICRAQLEKVDYVWFSAFDEAWKPVNNASDVETHWGVLKGDKTPKFKSPMYDCSKFVPSSKPGESGSDDKSSEDKESDEENSGKSSDKSSDKDSSSEIDGLDEDESDSESGSNDEDKSDDESGSNDEDDSSSGALSHTSISMVSVAASVVALTAAALF
ncbi:glycoside hydrolase 3 protein [Coemansia sp. RSA 560]|nr:glycoside hydrolase 3 protein [Coemansia sp. RSA 560]KAJ2201505.1 glycoside hydrolase 3 protein [Coemansia sp. RSA 522]KAJ2248638.1 glycoside hydrolase 3 protein [Coemansia sp. RSA 475]KAJ2291827.1 glycoside hydrolase 3 protein [Coemansia sp. RSA 355]